MKKKYYLNSYLVRNLGDDLFLKIITERYAKRFYIITNPKYKYNKYFNVRNIYGSIFIYYLKRITEKIVKHKVLKINNNENDILISLGGSMFIENTSISIKENYQIFNDFTKIYIIGANFGPYKNKDYLNYFENNIVPKCNDICFRDSYSKKIFKNKKIRLHPDVVFNLDIIPNPKPDNTVVFSLINCKKKNLKLYEKEYLKLITKLVKKYIGEKYNIVLMSFCKKEGDEQAIKELMSQFNHKEKKYIKIYKYRNNIDEALDILNSSKIIVGTRYHANILGILMRKKIIPIAYSNKTIDALHDLGIHDNILDIRNDNNNKIIEIDTSKLDIEKIKKSSEKQFEILDKELE